MSEPSTTNGDNANVLVWPPLLFCGAIALGWCLDALLPIGLLQTYGVAGWQFWLGLVVLIFGVFLALAGILAFRRAGTHVHPTHPALVVVKDGPYRLTRNPMYLGALQGLIGLAFVGSLDWLVILIPAVAAILHFGVVLREERYLSAKFGAEYSEYLAETRRWL